MKKIGFAAILFLALSAGAAAQEIPFIKGKQISDWKKNKSDTVYVINFWATWCKPCLEEMPNFELAAQHFAGNKVRFIMVSNDFKKQIESKLKPYLAENNLKNKVYYMNETNPNDWIERVDPNWQGSLPATLIFNNSTGDYKFVSGPLTYEELVSIISSFNP